MKNFLIIPVLLLSVVSILQAQEKPPWELRQEARDEALWKKEQVRMHTQAVKRLRKPIQEKQLVDYLWGANDPRVTRQGDSLVLVIMPVSETDLPAWTGNPKKNTPASDNPREMLWVSLDPELSFLFQSEPLMDSMSVAGCIKQFTGRAPQVDYPYIVSFWVSPKQLFRPTADPDPTTHFSTALYPENVDTDHKNWMESYEQTAYDLNPPHAWTRLGYACDWGNHTNSVGVSEFVVKPSAPILISKLSTIWLWYSEQMPVELLDAEVIHFAPEQE